MEQAEYSARTDETISGNPGAFARTIVSPILLLVTGKLTEVAPGATVTVKGTVSVVGSSTDKLKVNPLAGAVDEIVSVSVAGKPAGTSIGAEKVDGKLACNVTFTQVEPAA
jgi:hypothetical protein